MTSLCAEWTVNQLALPYLSFGETGPGGFLRALVASRFSVDGAVNRLVAEREVPPERLIAVAGTAVTSAGATGARKRARGLRLEATAIDWSHGEGRRSRGRPKPS